MVREDVPKWAGILGERTGRAGLEVADLFVQAWTDVETMAVNNPDAKQRADGDAFFLDMLELARRLNSPGITTLPGVRFGDESWDASIRRSAEGLKWRVDQAAKHDILVSIEPHLGSNVDTPDKVAQLVELAPGLKLSLDYPQFTFAGFSDSEIEPLLVHNRQLHCRGGAVGMMQASFRGQHDRLSAHYRAVERDGLQRLRQHRVRLDGLAGLQSDGQYQRDDPVSRPRKGGHRGPGVRAGCPDGVVTRISEND